MQEELPFDYEDEYTPTEVVEKTVTKTEWVSVDSILKGRPEKEGLVDLEKTYRDSDDNKCNILQMVKREPEWAANLIQHYEKMLSEYAGQEYKGGAGEGGVRC